MYIQFIPYTNIVTGLFKKFMSDSLSARLLCRYLVAIFECVESILLPISSLTLSAKRNDKVCSLLHSPNTPSL